MPVTDDEARAREHRAGARPAERERRRIEAGMLGQALEVVKKIEVDKNTKATFFNSDWHQA